MFAFALRLQATVLAATSSAALIKCNGDSMKLTVRKLARRLAVMIPTAICRELRLAEGTVLEVSTTADAIVLRRHGRRPRRPVAQIVAAMNPANYQRRRRERVQDPPVGKEVW